jgi:3-hydroxyisobutyrate dehydrogenase-like beta-hydroxyacid dehydrogenase
VPSAEVIALIAMGLLGSTLAETLIAAGFAVRSLLARDGHQGKRYESSWVRTP